MTKDHPSTPSVSLILERFFADYKHIATPIERRRINEVRKDLVTHLDIEGWRVLDDAQSAIFDAEHDFRPTGAFTRIARAPELFSALAHYATPTHAQLGIDQRATQLDVIEALTRMLWRDDYISGRTACPHCKSEMDDDLRKAREQLRGARERERLLAR